MNLTKISYKRHRFPPEIIANAVWLYARFNLSLREVEEMLLERGVDISYKTVRRWMAKFGPKIAGSCVAASRTWAISGISMRCVLRSQAGCSGSGGSSIKRASSWTKSCSANGTSGRRSDC